LRTGLTFSDGNPITSNEVISSWARLNFLLREKGSHSEFFEALVGADKVKVPGDIPAGLVSRDNETIVIKLLKPLPKLLEIISFGMYSVVSPKNYDPSTGRWLNKNVVISSNAYKILSWNKDCLSLGLRDDFPKIAHPNPFRGVQISWDRAHKLEMKRQMVFGPSNGASPVEIKTTFFGSTPSYISYAYCVPFLSKESPCFSTAFRRWLKLKSIQEHFLVTGQQELGFFPPGMKGSGSWNFDPTGSSEFSPQGINDKTLRVSYGINPNPYSTAYVATLKKILEPLNIQVSESILDYSEFDKTIYAKYSNRTVDIYLMYTGILIADPIQDLRFMFLSKEGVRLPDSTGEIKKQLAESSPSIEKISDLLDRQNLIWPLGHFALGFWYTDDIDTSYLNSTQPPIEFSWVGRR
jgi:ABC-type transport system substrate-binding protein